MMYIGLIGNPDTNATFNKHSPKLKKWLDQHQQSHDQCRMVFGEKGRYLAWTLNNEAKFLQDFVPTDAATAFRKIARIRVAAFGINGAYVFIANDGVCHWNLSNSYNELQAIMGALHSGDVKLVALNPFARNQFFILLKDNLAIYSVPESYCSQLKAALDAYGVKSTALTTQRLDSSTGLPGSGGFVENLLKHIVKQGLGSFVGQAVNGIISGVASCSVM